MKRYLMLAVGLAAAIGVGLWFTGSGGGGSAVETAAPASGAANRALVDVTLPETLSADAQIGLAVFEAKCAVCHGVNAAGQDGVAPSLIQKIYEPSHHGDAAFLMAARNGVQAHHWRFGNMPPIEGLTDGDVKMIVAYVRELQRTNGIN